MGWENLKINFPDNPDKIERKKPEVVEEDEEKIDPLEEDLQDDWQRKEADEILKAKNKIFSSNEGKGATGLIHSKIDSDLYYRNLEKERKKKRRKSHQSYLSKIKKSSLKPSMTNTLPNESADKKSRNWPELTEEIYSDDKDVMSDIDPSRNYRPGKR